jgi:hypothetical protein
MVPFGATGLTDAHEKLLGLAGNAPLFNDIPPICGGAAKIIPETLLWLLHKYALCAAVVGQYAAYMTGMLPYVPATLFLYVVYPNGDTYISHADIDAIFQK